MKRLLTILYALSLLLSFISNSQAQVASNASVSVKATPSSSHLVTAEITSISFAFTGLNSYPERANIELEEADMFFSHASVDRVNRQNIYYLHYSFQAVKKGSYVIPAIKFRTASGDIQSEKIDIEVYGKDALSEKSANIDGQPLTYYTLTKATKSSLFPNETTHLEHKVYLPQQLKIALWGLPLGDKKNCSAWRFKTPSRRAMMSRARINGKTYQAGSFHTNLTSLKQGEASIGPLKGRVVFHARVMTNRGLENKQFEIQAESDQLVFKVNPLPKEQPEHFRGDVGIYAMSASIDAPREINFNDSIQAITQLKGRGNLATVNPPLLMDMEGWKIISQNRTDLGEDRKSAQGTAEFTYLIQPELSKAIPTQTPSFLFSVLNPDTGKYRTMRIPGKPITVLPGKTSAEYAESPFNGLITNPQLGIHKLPWYKKVPVWFIHILPASFLFVLFLKHFLRRLRNRRLTNSERDMKRKALAELEKVDSLFLKSAGTYVERWIDTDEHPDAKEILSLRDSLCFRPESRQDVSIERRKKIISILRKCSLVLLFTFFLLGFQATGTTQQALSSFEQKDYVTAIDHFSSLPEASDNPDILYNIGLIHQLNKDSGMAAYYYHMALKIDADHASSIKNLNYIESENASIIGAKPTDIETWIGMFHPATYLHLIIFFTSTIFCLALTFIFIKPRASAFRIVIILCIFTPILLSLTVYGYVYHPDKTTYELESAVILKQTALTSQPLSNSQVVMDAPPASRCHMIAKRGKFSYIILANGVKGWVASERVKIF